MKLISIVIPCYNSEATIRKVVEMVMEEFKKNEQILLDQLKNEFNKY